MSRLQEDCYNPALLLSEQYRMAPAIASWPHRAYYGNRVRTAGSVLRRAQPWSGPVREYCMIDTGVVEVDGTVGRSVEAADQGSFSKYDTSFPCLASPCFCLSSSSPPRTLASSVLPRPPANPRAMPLGVRSLASCFWSRHGHDRCTAPRHNRREAHVVCALARRLVGVHGVQPASIGIISFLAAQVPCAPSSWLQP